METAPALVSILRQGAYLIASIHTALDDSEMLRFQRDLIDQIGRHGDGPPRSPRERAAGAGGF